MVQPLKLNQIAVIIDGSTVLSSDDIYELSFGTLTEEPNVEKTFGIPVHTIPTEGEKEFTVTVTAMSNGQQILAGIVNENNISPQYHTFSFYDGGLTTTQYLNVLLKSVEPNIDKDSTVTYAYTFSALGMKMSAASNK